VHGRVMESVTLGDRLVFSGETDRETLGTMVHGFLAASKHYDRGQWFALAQATLTRWRMPEIFASELVQAAERYRHVMTARYPEFEEWVEWPVHREWQGQIWNGWIDGLWSGPRGYVVVDHKTFPGSEDLWEQRALSYVPQLSAYRDMLEAAGDEPVVDLWIHFPVLGQMLRIAIDGEKVRA